MQRKCSNYNRLRDLPKVVCQGPHRTPALPCTSGFRELDATLLLGPKTALLTVWHGKSERFRMDSRQAGEQELSSLVQVPVEPLQFVRERGDHGRWHRPHHLVA